MTSDHHFQVDLRGVIDLLSEHLYSGPQVYIREMLQNSVDAIAARRKHEPEHTGSIRLEVMAGGDADPNTLVVHDDGVGLTEEEVHKFLATIGNSSKRDAISRDDFIGQFGIGLLSGFVVCEEVVLITRSIQPGSPTIQWKGRSDGTYSVKTLDHDFEPGTQVFLRGKPGCREFLEASFITDMARKYGEHLPMPIDVVVDGETTRINTTPPWRYSFASSGMQKEEFLAYGEAAFDEQFLDAIPISSETGGVEGVAYILAHSSNVVAKKRHRVYLKDMLISETGDELLPDWAFFVRCVLNAKNLKPTASREGFHDDEVIAATRDELGASIRRYLVQLAKTDRPRLDNIIALHHLPIKGLAVEDEDCFRLFVDWLPFETTLGLLSMGEYRERFPVVRYVKSRDQFRQITGVSAAQQLCIINANYTYDVDLIERLPQVFPDQKIENVDVSQVVQEFEDLTLQEREEVFNLVQVANLVLQPYQCTVDVRKFQPVSLATLYTANEAASFLRSLDQSKEKADELWSGVLDRIGSEATSLSNAQLCMNYENPLTKSMAKVTDKNVLKRAVEMLYVQALLLGHYPLKEKEMALLNQGLLALIEDSVAGGDE